MSMYKRLSFFRILYYIYNGRKKEPNGSFLLIIFLILPQTVYYFSVFVISVQQIHGL